MVLVTLILSKFGLQTETSLEKKLVHVNNNTNVHNYDFCIVND